MFYVFSREDEGRRMSYKETVIGPESAEEHDVNINGAEAVAGINDTVIYIKSNDKIDRRGIILFVKYFILKFNEYDWWARNVTRMKLLEDFDVIATAQ